MSKAENGTGALLEQVALADVLDDWGQGILAIGTFGYDPSPNSFNQQVPFHLLKSEEELEELENKGPREDGVEVENETSDDEGGTHNALVLNASKHGFSNKDIVSDHDQNATKSEMITMLDVRITLADLFLADSEEYMQHKKFDKDQEEVLNKPKLMKKAEGKLYSKLKLPFTKKFIPLKKQEYTNSNSHSRGLKNVHRVSIYREEFDSKNRGIMVTIYITNS